MTPSSSEGSRRTPIRTKANNTLRLSYKIKQRNTRVTERQKRRGETRDQRRHPKFARGRNGVCGFSPTQTTHMLFVSIHQRRAVITNDDEGSDAKITFGALSSSKSRHACFFCFFFFPVRSNRRIICCLI